MKKKLTTLFLIFFIHSLYGQNPLVKQWDYRFGGINDDVFTSLQQTTDDGYVLGGWSSSGISGDKTQASWGASDYWVVKTDSLGIKQWDKRFGGTDTEWLYSLQQTSDDGYILGGWSSSGAGGDKTQPSWGAIDYWIVKIDSAGIKQWDKRFGGTDGDWLEIARQTTDGGYILGGWTPSGVSGDKTQPSWGGPDFWIVKTDSAGNKQWDKRYGGTALDELLSLDLTFDGGYILGGRSSSGISGDKTQPNWGLIPNNDYWVVKIDSVGNKQWDKDFGGTENDELWSLQQTSDSGYILGGFSYSGISGNKTQPSWGSSDYWMVKIDSAGNKQWDKRFGGTNDDGAFVNVFQTSDNGYIIDGTSYSSANGDKTENNLGQSQTWVVKTNASGIKEWDKTIFTAGGDLNADFTQTNDGCYTIGVRTTAGIGGYKTQPNWDVTNASNDYWIIKFCDTTTTTSITQLPNTQFPFSISPNPFTNELSITIQKEKMKEAVFSIYNTLGERVFVKKENNISNRYTKMLNLSFLPRGIYVLEVLIDGERTIRKMVKD